MLPKVRDEPEREENPQMISYCSYRCGDWCTKIKINNLVGASQWKDQSRAL